VYLVTGYVEYAVKLAYNEAAATANIRLDGNRKMLSARLRQSMPKPPPANSMATRKGITYAASPLAGIEHR
jgi:hypothetical protein